MTEIPAREVPNFDAMVNPGDFVFTHNQHGEIIGMIEMCPCGCGATGGINFDVPDGRGVQNSPKWKWNGSKDKPTLTPSILRTAGCRWHGYLTNGVFISC